MKKRVSVTVATLALLMSGKASATVKLMDNDGWKVNMNGFLESDFMNDSTRSLNEIIGNSPVARPGTYNGDNGRTQFSARNSRLGFMVYSPEQDGWKSKGVLELDFFGYDPVPATSGTKNSESSYYQNPTLRLRHAYFTTENEDWQILAGQTWTLFGWQPYYFPTILTVSPGPGELFQRNVQVMAMRTIKFGDSRMQVAASMERPSQRDSSMPNMNVGVRYSLDSWKGAYASTYGDIKNESLSVGVSGSFRQFETPISATETSSQSHKNSSAIAVNGLIPLLPASGSDNLGNSLALNFEFTSGSGYADTLPNWSGGLNGFPQGAAGTIGADTNLDAGFGGIDSNGNFDLVKLQTFNVSLQYVLPESWHSLVTMGYSSIYSNNVGDFVASATTAADIYDRSSMYFINYIHDFTKQIRVGAEYDKVQTHYVSDGASPYNNRFQLTALYRF